MKTRDDLEDLIRQANCDAPETTRRRIWKDVAEKLAPLQAAGPSVMRRPTLRSPVLKMAAAAGITLAAACGLLHVFGPFRAATPAYGMTDLPGLLGDARTLHVQSTEWLYQPDPNRPEFEQATVIPCELWVDVPNLRVHFTSSMSWSTPKGEKGLNRVEGVHTWQYAMDIDHTKKTVRFNKVSLIQQRLDVRDQIQRNLNSITEGQLEHFLRVGQETINGTPYDIWEGENVDLHDANVRKRVRCWLAPPQARWAESTPGG